MNKVIYLLAGFSGIWLLPAQMDRFTSPGLTTELSAEANVSKKKPVAPLPVPIARMYSLAGASKRVAKSRANGDGKITLANKLIRPADLSGTITASIYDFTLLTQAAPLSTSGTAGLAVKDVEKSLNQLPGGLLTKIGTLIPLTASEPRYLAIGGGLTAGYRNGGLYREAQLTAYPNLIARQMGLINFKQPLFDLAQGNGSGYKQLDPNSQYAQYTAVNNKLAVITGEPLTFTPYTGQPDNLGMPYMGLTTAFDSEEWRYNSVLAPGIPYDLVFRPYFRRLLPTNNQQWTTTYIDYIRQQRADFCTIELGFDDAIWYATNGGYRLAGMMNQINMPEGNPLLALLANMKQKGMKGIVATVPDVLTFPYFKTYPLSKLKQLNGGKKVYAVDNDVYDIEPGNTEHIKEMTAEAILLPTTAVTALFNTPTNTALAGYTVANPLASRDVLSVSEINTLQHISALNETIITASAKNNVPIVDLAALMNKILAGNYVSDDGFKIDPAFPDGNFFSQDGLYPSAVGQAVIANEWIKVINQYYKTSIPLISIRQVNDLLK